MTVTEWANEYWYVLVAASILIVVAIHFVQGGRVPRSRPCPRCGERVKVGMLDCDACGFNFRAIGNDKRPQREAGGVRGSR